MPGLRTRVCWKKGGAQFSDHLGILGEKMGGAVPAPGQRCALVCVPEKVFPSVTWTVDECGAAGEAGGPGTSGDGRNCIWVSLGWRGKLGKGCDITAEKALRKPTLGSACPAREESQPTDIGLWWQKMQFTVKAPDKSPGVASAQIDSP